jgi:hypothetical protein
MPIASSILAGELFYGCPHYFLQKKPRIDTIKKVELEILQICGFMRDF